MLIYFPVCLGYRTESESQRVVEEEVKSHAPSRDDDRGRENLAAQASGEPTQPQ